MTADHNHRYAVVVAGGSGTRLWPLSRQKLPKQMQSLMSDKTLIAETVDRLAGVISPENIFISTTANYLEQIHALLPAIASENFIVEPEARGTPAAFALLANRIHQLDPEAVVFSLASDHAITEVGKFQQAARDSFDFIERHPGSVAIVGIKPTRPDTGLGYLQARGLEQEEPPVYRVQKFVEKPTLEVAAGYVEAGDHYWNSAYYCFRAATLLAAYQDADPRLVEGTAEYLRTGDAAAYFALPVKVHEIDIIDAAKYPLALVPADFTWSDIGSWAALHRTLSELVGSDVVSRNAAKHTDINSCNVLVQNTDDREVVTAGLENIGVITTEDVVLVVNLKRLEEMPGTMQELFTRLRTEGKADFL